MDSRCGSTQSTTRVSIIHFFLLLILYIYFPVVCFPFVYDMSSNSAARLLRIYLDYVGNTICITVGGRKEKKRETRRAFPLIKYIPSKYIQHAHYFLSYTYLLSLFVAIYIYSFNNVGLINHNPVDLILSCYIHSVGLILFPDESNIFRMQRISNGFRIMKRVQELDNNRKEGGALSFILYGPKQISNFRAITLSPCGFFLLYI